MTVHHRNGLRGRLTIDFEKQLIRRDTGASRDEFSLYSREGFEVVSEIWLQVGWNEKYPYTFTWLGRPIIQLPEDLLRIQEVIFKVRPTLVIETGVAHGGSLAFYATILNALGGGQVVGVDIEIRAHNRTAIEKHPLAHMIRLIEGDSVSQPVLDSVRELIRPTDVVLVILDSDHSMRHVLAELDAYQEFVSVGSYVVATDGIMREVAHVPRGSTSWVSDNPSAAAELFVDEHDDFILEDPAWLFNESSLTRSVTHWPNAYVRRLK